MSGLSDATRSVGPGRRASMALIYGGLLAAAALTFVVVNAVPHTASLGAAPPAVAHASGSSGGALQLLRTLLTLLLVSSVLAAVCRRLHQPPVIGEILAGILLGPSLLGRLAPSVSDYLVPLSVTPQLTTLSQIGVLLFMFLVGLELDLSTVRANSRANLLISHASIVVPLVLGALAAIWLYPRFAPRTVSLPVFALFLGVSLAVTAFPVLARILTDNSLQRTRMGAMALTCAAIDDVTAWCLLALLVSVAKQVPLQALVTFGATLAFIGAVFGVLRPLVARWLYARAERPVSRRAIALVLAALLGCALVTEYIGIHAIFGALALGAIIPHDSRLSATLRSKFHDVCVILLMPAFYALVGMRTQLSLVSGAAEWLVCGLIIVIASLGKFGGSYAAARFAGVARADAVAIGILMNTRGLMELVVLDLGLSLGVISPQLFAMMVVMALVTTFSTSPLLKLTSVWSVGSTTASPQLAEEVT
jgi:Kef-type K+ transport system membrane component KefB